MWKFLRRRNRDGDLDDELQLFVDELTARNVARGMAPDAARRAALVETGGLQQVREATRDVWTLSSLEAVARDVRYGVRLMARTPGFAFVVVATLALGIGANVTMFSVMHAVLWQPLPYPAADRLMILDADYRGRADAGVAGGELDDLRERSQLLEHLATLVGVDAYVDVDRQLERATAASVSDEMLPLLGAAAAPPGRLPDSSQDLANDRVSAIVVSDEFRRRWYPGDAEVIGRRLRVNNLDVQIVGVLTPGLRVFLPPVTNAAEQIDVWFPTRFEPGRRARGYHAVARLKPGVTRVQAQAELDTLSAAFTQEYPDAYPDGQLRLHLTPLQATMAEDVGAGLWALGGAVAFVLLICCVNVANLMLARARSRERELAVRRALGGSRERIVRQLFTENATLVVLGGVLLAAAYAGIALIDWLRPTHLPRQSQIAVNGTVALFSVALTALVATSFGLLPAFGEGRDSPAHALTTGRSAVMRSGARRLQRALVIAEVALSIVPLVAGGLMLRSFIHLTQAPLGFEPDGRLTARMSYRMRAFPNLDQRWALHREALDRVRQLPGVIDVSAATPLPFAPLQQTRGYGRPDDAAGPQARATFQSVMPGYLRVAGVALRAGRDFTADDIVHQRLVVIVDERVANRLWPAGAVGQQLAIETGRVTTTAEVIGVTTAVRVTQVRDDATPHVFVPYHFFPAEMSLVMRTDKPASALIPAVRQAVESLGTERPVTEFLWMRDYVDRSIGDSRFTMLILVGFGAASILLAAVGLYGTLAYLTSLRTQEFGVRMALGASTARVLRSVASEGLVLATAGAAIGFAGAMAMTGVLQALLYNVTPFDGVTLAGVIVIVGVAALVAALHPAWRASRISPTVALRAGE